MKYILRHIAFLVGYLFLAITFRLSFSTNSQLSTAPKNRQLIHLHFNDKPTPYDPKD